MSSARITAKSLYKNILRAHERYLPHEMKQLGDAYVKAEVRISFVFTLSTALRTISLKFSSLTFVIAQTYIVPITHKSKA